MKLVEQWLLANHDFLPDSVPMADDHADLQWSWQLIDACYSDRGTEKVKKLILKASLFVAPSLALVNLIALLCLCIFGFGWTHWGPLLDVIILIFCRLFGLPDNGH